MQITTADVDVHRGLTMIERNAFSFTRMVRILRSPPAGCVMAGFRNAANSFHAESVTPGVEGTESELRGRLTAILRARSPLMRVLSVARHLCLPDWLVFSGAVYQPVLNHLTGRPLDHGIKDYDLAYFDASDIS
jgi:hypothetical protein